MTPDERALARLEPVQCSRRIQCIEPCHEPLLPLRPGLRPERQRPFLARQHGIERGLATRYQPLSNLRRPRSVDLTWIRVERVALPGLQGTLVDGGEGVPRWRGAAPT